MRTAKWWRRKHPDEHHLGETGVSLVEVLAASFILTITFVSLASVLIHSISTGHLAQQRQTAASLASDVLENGRALGLSCLVAASVTPSTPATVAAAILACPTVLQAPGELPGTWTGLQPPSTSLVQSAAFFTPATLIVDATTYTITVLPLTSAVPGTSSLKNLTVRVAWTGSSYSAVVVVGY